MAIGNSGRIVIEVPTELKREIHTALKASGLTMKEWFLKQVEAELLKKAQKNSTVSD
ncbi:hypothetical protein [Endozoicomonas sp. Mp262]|uniref:hypothetical protein n=1 Tax=Endozoicomonas sp. Mp262 TaxID=2919499 RepID=UPI0021E05E5A